MEATPGRRKDLTMTPPRARARAKAQAIPMRNGTAMPTLVSFALLAAALMTFFRFG